MIIKYKHRARLHAKTLRGLKMVLTNYGVEQVHTNTRKHPRRERWHKAHLEHFVSSNTNMHTVYPRVVALRHGTVPQEGLVAVVVNVSQYRVVPRLR